MKTSKNDNTVTVKSHSSRPFFYKGGEGNFFTSSKDAESPFFLPSNTKQFQSSKGGIQSKVKYTPNTNTGIKRISKEPTYTEQQSEDTGRKLLATPRVSMIQKQTSTPDVSAMTDAEIRAEITRIEAEIAGHTESSVTRSDLQTTLDLLRREEAERIRLAPQLNAITARYTSMITDARSRGMNVAADNLQHFLTGSGTTRTLGVSWLRGFSAVTDAEEVNQDRFQSSLHELAISMPSGTTRTFNDHWDRRLTGGMTTELFYASGTSTITSTGSFSLTKRGNIVTITGTVSHHWWDPYDWHANLSAFIPGHGSISDADALLLQRYRQARPYHMESDWTQTLSGTIEVVNWLPDSVNLVWSGP